MYLRQKRKTKMRLNISLAVNVSNLDEIQKYLDSIKIGNEKIDKWIQGNLRKYIVNADDNDIRIGKITTTKKTDPQWLQEAVKRGEEVFDVDLGSRFKRNIEHVISYLKTVADPSRISVPDAIKGSKDIVAQQIKKDSNDDRADDIKVIYKFSNGYKWVSILTERGILREGRLMQNCLGDEENYTNGVENGDLEIWSLRDPTNEPHCTIEYDTVEMTVNQLKGKQNDNVAAKYIPYVEEFLHSSAIKDKITGFNEEELLHIGIWEQDAKWYQINNLPNRFRLDGDLDIGEHTEITQLTEGLHITGDLSIGDYHLKELPKGLVVDGELRIMHGELTSLPDDMVVKSNIEIESTGITNFPQKLKVVNGDLTLLYNKIKELPRGLTIKGNLKLRGNDIKSLPDDLVVKGIIDVKGSAITQIAKPTRDGAVEIKPATIRTYEVKLSTSRKPTTLTKTWIKGQPIVFKATPTEWYAGVVRTVGKTGIITILFNDGDVQKYEGIELKRLKLTKKLGKRKGSYTTEQIKTLM